MKKNKTLIVLLIVAGIAGIILVGLLDSPQADTNVRQVAVKEESDADGSDIVKILSGLKKVNLNTDFFDNEGFLSLEDFSTQLPRGDIGKTNPFSNFVSSGPLDN